MANFMARLNSTFATVIAFGMLAVAISLLLNWGPPTAQAPAVFAADVSSDNRERPQWAASATGRVEPKDGEVRITAQTRAKIAAVYAEMNEKVSAGDVLVRLDDTDLLDRMHAAEEEALVRQREREEEPAEKGPAQQRRDASDAVYSAERKLFGARMALDEVAIAVRGGDKTEQDLKTAKDQVEAAKKTLSEAQAELARINALPDMPLPTRLESSLSQARSELNLLENAVDRTRVRAPYDGTVLTVWAKVGETAVPSPQSPLILFGDLSTLRVRAELEERDVTKVVKGQDAVVRVDAYGDKDFPGKVTSIANSLGAPRIASRGPRRPNDVEVLEVLVDLDGEPPLLTGMRVDVFFKAGQPTN